MWLFAVLLAVVALALTDRLTAASRAVITFGMVLSFVLLTALQKSLL